jgi:hypothetical protein
MIYACPAWELSADTYLLKIAAPTKQGSPHHWKFSGRDLHTAFSLPYVYVYITKLCRQQAEVIQNRENEHVHSIGQGEVRHGKYKRLKLGGGEAYDRSRDKAARCSIRYVR